ncbi:hypothetical protein ABIF90_000935 [Bradyrhizobium japonicum]
MSCSAASDKTYAVVVREAWRDAPASVRLDMTSDQFIFTSPIKDVLRKLRLRVEELPTRKSKCVIILSGPDGVGKTALVKHFAESFSQSDGEGLDYRPVVIASPIGKSDSDTLAKAVISACNWPVQLRFRSGMPSEDRMNYVLAQCRTRMLILTRADFLLSDDEKRIASETVRFLVRLLDRSSLIVTLVASPTLSNILNFHPKLRGKLSTLFLGPIPYGRRWYKALEQYDAGIPFESGSLTVKGMPEMLHLGSEGRLPCLSRLTRDAGRFALSGAKRSDRILKEHFEKAFSEFRPQQPNPFSGDRDPSSLLAEIGRRSSGMPEHFGPTDNEKRNA